MNGVRRYRNGQSSVAGFGTGSPTFGTRPTGSAGGGPPWSESISGPTAKIALDASYECTIGGLPNASVNMRVDLRDEPFLAVVVVDDEHAVGGQVVAHRLERLLGEQERLEPDVRGRADEGQRVRQREDDEVVLLVRVAQERAAVVDVDGDPRILVRVVRVEVDAELLDLRDRSRPHRRGRRPFASAIATSVPVPAPTIRTSGYFRPGNHL